MCYWRSRLCSLQKSTSTVGYVQSLNWAIMTYVSIKASGDHKITIRSSCLSWSWIIISPATISMLEYYIVHLYSVQYLPVHHDSRCCLTHPESQLQPKISSDWHSSYWSQSWRFTSSSTARVILGQVLGIVTCGSQTHTYVTICGLMPILLTHWATGAIFP